LPSPEVVAHAQQLQEIHEAKAKAAQQQSFLKGGSRYVTLAGANSRVGAVAGGVQSLSLTALEKFAGGDDVDFGNHSGLVSSGNLSKTIPMQPPPAPLTSNTVVTLTEAPPSITETFSPDVFRITDPKQASTRPTLITNFDGHYPASDHPLNANSKAHSSHLTSKKQETTKRWDLGAIISKKKKALEIAPEHRLRAALRAASPTKSTDVKTPTFDFGPRTVDPNIGYFHPSHGGVEKIDPVPRSFTPAKITAAIAPKVPTYVLHTTSSMTRTKEETKPLAVNRRGDFK
jgi:hypothetical protein